MGINPILPIEVLLLLVASAVIGGTLTAWLSSRRCAVGRRIAMVTCRAVALLCLGAIALNPGHWRRTAQETEGEWALLLDRSASMATSDADGESRWVRALDLADEARKAADDPERVPLYIFSEDVRSAAPKELRDASPDGQQSDIVGASSRLLDRYRSLGRRLTGVLVISDGRQLPARPVEPVALRATSRETRIFALPVGGPVARQDLRIELVRRHHVGFVGQMVPIGVRVHSTGLGPVRSKVELVAADGALVDEQAIEVRDGDSVAVTLSVQAKEAGYAEYVVRVAPLPAERDPRNNQARTGLSVLRDPIRILLVEGVPHWDTKFLAQLLRAQPNVRLSSIYRLGSDRYFFVGSDAADVSDSEAPIFPDEPGELGQYDVVVFGKGAEYFLTPRRVQLLRDFVRDQGGGLLFARGKPYTGTFQELEPLEPVTWGAAGLEVSALRPTASGEDVGLFGDLLPAAEDGVWNAMPAFRVTHRCDEISSFAQVLAEGVASAAGGAGHPLLISRRYGKGLIVAMNASDLWRWDFFPSVSRAAELYESLWSQLVQWMVTFAEFLPGQTHALRLSGSTAQPGDSLRATITARAADASAPAPSLSILDSDGAVALYPAVGNPAVPGRWDVLFSIHAPGDYRAVAVAADTGLTLAPAIPLRVDPPPAETDELSADPEFLRRLAVGSGGRLVSVSNLASVVRELAPEKTTVSIGKAVWSSAWNRWWLLCATVLLFATEWIVRRRSGLL